MSEVKDVPEAGLYIRCETDEAARLLPKLREIFLVMKRSAYTNNMHIIEVVLSGQEQSDIEAATLFVQVALSNGVVALVRGNADFAKASEADGVVVNTPQEIKAARDVLGPEALIAVLDITNTEQAGVARTAGADLIGVKQTASGLFDLKLIALLSGDEAHPVLAQGYFTNDNVRDAVMMGASFIECADYLFNYDKGSMKAAVNILYAIDLVGDSPAH